MIYCRKSSNSILIPNEFYLKNKQSTVVFMNFCEPFFNFTWFQKKTEFTINKIIISMIVWSQLKLTNEQKTLIKSRRFLY